MTAATVPGTGRARLVSAAMTVGVIAWWTLHQGGAAPSTWYLGALVVLLVLLAAVWAGVVAPPGRAATVAIGALAAFTLWSFVSIAWATARGDAWDGANRTLPYLTVFALFALLPWRPSEAGGPLAPPRRGPAQGGVGGGGGAPPSPPSAAPRRWWGWGSWWWRRSAAPRVPSKTAASLRPWVMRTRAPGSFSPRSGPRSCSPPVRVWPALPAARCWRRAACCSSSSCCARAGARCSRRAPRSCSRSG